MKRSTLFLPALLVVFSLACSSLALAQGPRQSGRAPQRPTFLPAPGAKYVPDHVLVRFRAGTIKEAVASAHMTVGAQVLRAFSAVDGLQLVRLPAGVPVQEAIRLYRRNPTVLYAEPDYVRHADITPNDPQWPSLWGMVNIRAPQAWDSSTGSSNVVVGVIDTGADYNHSDLAANIYRNTVECSGAPNTDNDGNGYKNDCHGINAITNSGDPMDDNDHGTHVAGTIGAVGNNGVGVVGVNWRVKILPCKFLDASGSGSDSDAIKCLEYFAWMHDHGANIVAINASWGGYGYDQALSDAINAQVSRGILFFAAAGNGGSDNIGDDNDLLPHYPSSYYLPNLVSVAAIDSVNSLASFSNYGRRSVYLGAPGVGIRSTIPGDSYDTYNGTSMATPHVTGVAALLAAQNPARDWKTIRNLILAGGAATSALNGKSVTGRRLDAYGAITCSGSTATAWLQPRSTSAMVSIGGSLLLAALNINCGSPNGDVLISVSPGSGTATLHDDGSNGDQVAGDGIYTGHWTPPAEGTYTLTLPGGSAITVHAVATYLVAPGTYSWRNICGTGTPLLGLDDDSVALVSPGFAVSFGNTSFSSFYVSSNGTIAFNDAFSGFNPASIPTSLTPTLVAPFWDDLHPIAGDPSHTVYWQTGGTRGNQEVVVAWCAVPHYGSGSTSENVTFEAVMFESRPDVLLQYQDTTFGGSTAAFDAGAGASVGVQTATNAGASWSYESPSLSAGLALLFTMPNTSPRPTIASISPTGAVPGSPGFPLTVTGSNFLPNSIVRWNGNDRTTYYDSPTQLHADIPASDVASPSSWNVVSVFNPPPGGGANIGTYFFNVGGTNPVPVITSISPSSVAGSMAPLTVTLHGTGFVPGSQVWKVGNPALTTHFLNTTTLTADIPSQFHTLAGNWEMQVVNSAPGGGSSATAGFEVTSNIVPIILSFTPSYVRAGGPAFTLNLQGSYFAGGAVAYWNGSPRVSTQINIASLNASITASDIATAGSIPVTATNPSPGGGMSAAAFLPVWGYDLVAPVSASVLTGIANNIPIRLHPVSGQQSVDASCIAITHLPGGTTCSIVGGPTFSLAGGDVNVSVVLAIPAGPNPCGGGTGCSIRIHTVDHDSPALPAHDAVVNLHPPVTASSDFDADGHADILWQHLGSGDVAAWLMNGATRTSAAVVASGVDLNWKSVGVGDFGGDAKADILWQNSSTGGVVVWLMNGTTRTSSAFVATGVDANWKVVGVGDFDGDGKADILWQNSVAGGVVVWIMNGASRTSSAFVATGVDPGWKVVGVGDFDGDGKADILWQNSATGDVAVWLMNGAARISAAVVASGVDPNWKAVGLGDFGGDGKADILWQNSGTGGVVVWIMNGVTRTSSAFVATGVDPNWKAVAVRDFDGDGRADILWQNSSSGGVVVWIMDGATRTSSAFVATGVDPNWKVVSSHP